MSILYKKHHLYPESVLIRKFVGKVSSDEIIDSWEYLKEKNLISKKIIGIINDLSNCELLMDMEGFKSLMDYMKKQNSFKGIKLAVICNSPETIIFPLLGESQEKELKIKPFSTQEAAVKWVSINI